MACLPLTLRALVLVPLLAVAVDQARATLACGPPAAWLAIAGYASILATLARDGEWGRTTAAFLALAGLGFSGWLTYVEVARLEAICVWCVGSAACMAVLAGLAVARLLSPPPPPGRRG